MPTTVTIHTPDYLILSQAFDGTVALHGRTDTENVDEDLEIFLRQDPLIKNIYALPIETLRSRHRAHAEVL